MDSDGGLGPEDCTLQVVELLEGHPAQLTANQAAQACASSMPSHGHPNSRQEGKSCHKLLSLSKKCGAHMRAQVVLYTSKTKHPCRDLCNRGTRLGCAVMRMAAVTLTVCCNSLEGGMQRQHAKS